MAVPNIKIVKEQKTYNTFIAQLPHDFVEGPLRAIEEQCKALMFRGSLGFATIVPKPDGGHCLVFSLPIDTRGDYRHAAGIVKDMLSRAFWGDVQDVHRFLPEETERVANSTKHMTKCHISILGWEQYTLSPEQYLERAASMTATTATMTATVHSIDEDPKEAFPMLQNVDDDVLRAAMKSGFLVSALTRFFGLTPSKPSNIGTLAIEFKHMDDDECKHMETHVIELPQYCSYCYGCVSLSTGACIDCDKMADISPCGGCGGAPLPGSLMRHKCTACQKVLCNSCNNAIKSYMISKEEEDNLLEMMQRHNKEAEYSEYNTHDTVPFSNIVALVDNLPDDDLFEPKSPALVRLLKDIAEDERNLRKRARTSCENECQKNETFPSRETLKHPFLFDGVETAEMKQYDSRQIEEAMLHKLKERSIKLWWPGASPLNIQSQLPAFLDLYKELFGDCHAGDQGMTNMINKKVRPLFEKLASNELRQAGLQENFKLPQMTDLEPVVWDHLERVIKGNPKITKCRACAKHFNTKLGEVVCSEQCRTKHQAAHNGLVCATCANPIVKKHIDRYSFNQVFYNPGDNNWYPAELLDLTESEIIAVLRPGASKMGGSLDAVPEAIQGIHDGEKRIAFVMATRMKKNPIMFCSGECEGVWRNRLICKECGWEAGKDGDKECRFAVGRGRDAEAVNTNSRTHDKVLVPNLDDIPKSSSSTEFERFSKAKKWKQRQSCAQCEGFMLPRISPGSVACIACSA